jgi:uncharacterized oligopeptide transporter (OPT) family protein
MDSEEDYSLASEQQEPASKHPKAWDPAVLILGIPLCALGAIIGLELIVRTGVTPNTSIIGALFAILLSRIPISIFRKYRSIHRQNLLQTSISAATFSAANCMILPIGIPVIMGRTDLMFPMLIGVTLATVVDATIMYNCFGSEMFPAEGSWPPGVAAADSILAVVEKGKKAFLLLIGIGIGVVGKIGTIPMDLLGVSWFGDFGAMMALGVGSIVIGILKVNGFAFSLFGHSFTFATNLFGADFVYSDHVSLAYMAHGVMIGAGVVSLVQCGITLFSKGRKSHETTVKTDVSNEHMKKTLGVGYVAYIAVAMLIAVFGGIYSQMSVPQFIIWLVFAAFAAEASELIVGISAMYSGWFPGFATALIFLIIGMLIGFPTLPLGLLVGFTAATGPCFSDMAYDLKCGYILRGNGANPELEKEGRKQQYYSELLGFVIAFIMVAFFANRYFDQGLYVAVSKTFVTTIDAGANAEIAKWLLIWAIPGAIIQLVGGKHQLGILFATGLLVGNILNGITIIAGLIIRLIAVRRNKENEQTLNILGAGALAGAAIYSFFSATLGLIGSSSKSE